MTTIVTHDGDFHADDVFGVATLLEVLNDDDVEIVRTRDEEWFKKADYVVDVGVVNDPNINRFDHHQPNGAGERENGIPYAGFGLVWKKYGEQLCLSKEIADEIDRKLVQPIDGQDNGVELASFKYEGVFPITLQTLLYQFRPTWKEEGKDRNEIFEEVVGYARRVLRREIEILQHAKEAEVYVRQAYEEAEDKRLIILEDKYPWGAIMEYPEPLFVVYPGRTPNTWRAKAVKESFETFTNRKDFPAQWGGLRDKDLENVSGVSGAAFCHAKLFTIAAYSKKAVLDMVQIAIDK